MKAPFYDVEDPDNRRSCGCRPEQQCEQCENLGEHWMYDAIRCDVCGTSAEVITQDTRQLYVCPNGCEMWELEGCIKNKLHNRPLQTPGIIMAMWEDFRPKESM